MKLEEVELSEYEKRVFNTLKFMSVNTKNNTYFNNADIQKAHKLIHGIYPSHHVLTKYLLLLYIKKHVECKVTIFRYRSNLWRIKK